MCGGTGESAELPHFAQLLDVDPQDQAEEDGGHMDLDSQRKGKCAVIKTSTRQVLLTSCMCGSAVVIHVDL